MNWIQNISRAVNYRKKIYLVELFALISAIILIIIAKHIHKKFKQEIIEIKNTQTFRLIRKVTAERRLARQF